MQSRIVKTITDQLWEHTKVTKYGNDNYNTDSTLFSKYPI